VGIVIFNPFQLAFPLISIDIDEMKKSNSSRESWSGQQARENNLDEIVTFTAISRVEGGQAPFLARNQDILVNLAIADSTIELFKSTC
jgi:hypothetical protein